MAIALAVESFDQVIGELRDLIDRKRGDLPRTQETPVDPNFDLYATMARVGCLTIYTVRDDGVLVGYASYFVGMSMHSKQAGWATSDSVWINPEARRLCLGRRLLRYIETDLRERGIIVSQTLAKPGSAFSRLLHSQGYVLGDLVYTRRITDA